MNKWFDEFSETLKGNKASADLIGAGTADKDRAIAHYRYQHQAKMREAVEVTFPRLLNHIEDWNSLWATFWEQNEISPRSLDWFPEVFLNFYLKTDAPLWKKELARFEHRLDIHPWNHLALSPRPEFVPDESSKIILGNHELISFYAPVMELSEGVECQLEDSQNILLWQKENGGTHFRSMKEWELNVFQALTKGVGVALELAPDEPEAVGKFFQWLGRSNLIQGLQED